MISETAGKISSIPQGWKFVSIQDGEVCFEVEGHGCSFSFDLFTDDALKTLRAIFLGKIHSITTQRWNLHRYLAMVNGEMDKRVNERVCRE
ncbi:MAG: hypothetical protein DWB56_14720 [Candidatus Jettenia sp.]|uniref:Uncharacterized protein n=1 Tax=Candidatus Jettenia caeni TaxID=247490 RepID=I3ILU4_9BACT|nr:MAG: hypothetical protein EDM70_10125 [Candidatus Brocadia sp. AMX2]MBC6930185.1 hypothetical protein [Candidatus Jettenia sp.]GAB62689.1 hypothetical protein KSU1_C1093 [Candidatus Jettenia caeni]MCQ3927059.1 hypothetical protein [Candidatus Jettenia sp.]GIL19483.1 MAG: hypothetical protein BroJett041_05970 [Candidatus Jettenia caeni]